MRRLRTTVLCLGLMFSGCGGADEVAGETGNQATGTSSAGPATSVAGSTSSTSTSSTSTGDAASSSTTASEPTSGAVTDDPGLTDAAGDSTGSTSTGSTSDGADSSSDDGGSSSSSTGAEEPPMPGPKVKIMTFNIRVGTANDGENAWDKRKQLVYQVFKDQDADFVGVQEALNFQLVEIDAAVTGYDRIGVGTEDGKTKGPLNAIYYKKSRFAVKNSQTFWLSNTPEVPGSQTWGNKFPRTVTWGRFSEKASDYTFYVYNTHFDHASQNSREKSAVLLAATIAGRNHPEDPFAVTGDFNAAEGNLATRFLKGDAKIDGQSAEVPLRDTFRVLKPHAHNVGTAHAFLGGTGGNKIDYVYVPGKQKVEQAYIVHFNKDGRFPSDHFPVVGKVTFASKN